ncbi:hypothetical protein BU24DRAFT_456861 [Aaosphaeria arxii CBS 175.79]|uniref:Ubiquitin carrier protein n=1 Tax=Aaosphaeria arxii CBS 175.79 TaxID=1450172 RepID=A0A6A5Y5J3_9PLEO|nr:uncharacterized protein BU24DRAFT_456861 [Aaosphaeria arxii CBS 175.79]KAF2020832.1 hypothetical protein BU24DRAFT_456861 [Aaosphaeria arxii CBS 175.79]
MGYVHYIARRSVEHPSVSNLFKRAVEDAPKLEVPVWGQVVFGVTFFAIIIGLSLLEYTLKDVIATLCMVETPSAAITVSQPNEDDVHDSKEGLLETGPAITLVHQKPITSSIRGTIRHLVAHAGRWSRFRGYKLHVLYSISFSMVSVIAQGMTSFLPGNAMFGSVIAGVAVANLHATWTHKVISMPTDKSLKERFVPRSNWKALVLPAAVQASAVHVSAYLAQGLAIVLGLDNLDPEKMRDYNSSQWTSLILRFVAVLFVLLFSALFIVLPALVTLIRVEASILPEDQDTIVPFDRSFAGKVVPKILGGSGAIGFVDAWRSFTWEARGRLIKLYFKISTIMAVLGFLFAQVILFEIYFIMGSALKEYFYEMQRRNHGGSHY